MSDWRFEPSGEHLQDAELFNSAFELISHIRISPLGMAVCHAERSFFAVCNE